MGSPTDRFYPGRLAQEKSIILIIVIVIIIVQNNSLEIRDTTIKTAAEPDITTTTLRVTCVRSSSPFEALLRCNQQPPPPEGFPDSAAVLAIHFVVIVRFAHSPSANFVSRKFGSFCTYRLGV